MNDPRRPAALLPSPPASRFAHLKNPHVVHSTHGACRSRAPRTAELPYFARDVTDEVVELGKPSGQVIHIPTRRIEEVVPLPDPAQEKRLLDLDGRLPVEIPQPRVAFLDGQAQFRRRHRELGFGRAAIPGDPLIEEAGRPVVRPPGSPTETTSLSTQPQGYHIVYDENGMFLLYGNQILMALTV